MVESEIPGGLEYGGGASCMECGRTGLVREYAPIGRKSCQGGGATINGYDKAPICSIRELDYEPIFGRGYI